MEKSDEESCDAGQLTPDAERTGVCATGTFTFGVGEFGALWPNNMIAADVIVPASRVMSRAGRPVRYVVDEADFPFCKRMAG